MGRGADSRLARAVAVCAGLLLVGCTSSDAPPPPEGDSGGAESAVSGTPAAEPAPAAANATDDRVVITTKYGDIVIDLFEEDAPRHAENFKKLAAEGFYDGLTFHRVMEGFMAQGGDPEGTGSGGPGYTIPAEIKRRHVRGSVAAARLGDNVNPQRASSGSQFYICFRATPQLDGAYTVFGQVVEGMEAVDQLKRVHPPVTGGDVMEKVVVKQVPAE